MFTVQLARTVTVSARDDLQVTDGAASAAKRSCNQPMREHKPPLLRLRVYRRAKSLTLQVARTPPFHFEGALPSAPRTWRYKEHAEHSENGKNPL